MLSISYAMGKRQCQQKLNPALRMSMLFSVFPTHDLLSQSHTVHPVRHWWFSNHKLASAAFTLIKFLSLMPGIRCWDRFFDSQDLQPIQTKKQLCTSWSSFELLREQALQPKLAKSLVDSKLWKEIRCLEHFGHWGDNVSQTNQLMHKSLNVSLMLWSQKTAQQKSSLEKVRGND